MFDNGSFLRRRRRFKKKELAPNSTTKLTDALKTLDKFGSNNNLTPAARQLQAERRQAGAGEELDEEEVAQMGAKGQLAGLEASSSSSPLLAAASSSAEATTPLSSSTTGGSATGSAPSGAMGGLAPLTCDENSHYHFFASAPQANQLVLEHQHLASSSSDLIRPHELLAAHHHLLDNGQQLAPAARFERQLEQPALQFYH